MTISIPTSTEPGADYDLSLIIMKVESNGNSQAIRFEPQTYLNFAPNANELSLIDAIGRCNACDFNTARVIFSTSFGRYQLMGFNIYSLGYSETIFDFVNDVAAQNSIFAKFLRQNGIDETWDTLKSDPEKLLKFASVYNGPGNPQAYVTAMQNAAKGLNL